MISRIEVSSSLPGVPVIPLGGFMPINDPVQVRNIDGLGPVKSDVSSTPFATGRGDLYQGSSTGKRNIVLTLGLNPNWADQTVSSLRQLLYRYFMPENWVTLKFFSDDIPTVYITGIVESFEPNIFSLDAEIQVSVLCPKPDFIEVDTTLIHGVTSTTDTTLVEYTGTSPTGFDLRIQPSIAVPSYSGEVTISNRVGPFSQQFKVQAVTVNAATYFQISTTKTTRQVFAVVVSTGQAINILAKMEEASTWPELNLGQNELAVVTSTPGLNWTLGYINRFGGL